MIKKIARMILSEEISEFIHLERQLRLEIDAQKDLVARIKFKYKRREIALNR